MAEFVHPETGEILQSHEEFLEALLVIENRLGALYQLRRPIREAMTERFPAPELPGPVRRTATQEKVARCPRCGTPLETEKPG